MVTKIKRMTPEQEAALPAFREQWRAEALRTDRINEDEARAAINNLYTVSGLNPPRLVIFAQSPMQALLMRGVLRMGGADQLRDQLWDQLGGQLGDQLRGQLWGQLWGQLGDQLRGQLRGQLGDQLWDQLGDQLRGQLGGQLWGQLGDQLRGQLRGQLGDQLWDQLGDQLRGQLGDQLHSGGLWQALYFAGGWDAFWVANYDYARKSGMRLEPGLNARLDAYIQYTRTCGAAFLYPEIAIACDRPTGLSFDAERRLHCENSPAITYADGYSVYAWRGVRIPEEWVTQGLPDAQTLLRWENMEQRTVAGDVMGWDKLIEPLPQTVIDKDDDPVIGELIQVDDMPDTDGPEYYLKARCGTGRVICMNVTPSVVEEGCRTALEAGASTYRLPPDLYRAGSANRT